MQVDITDGKVGEKKITITVPLSEQEKHLDKAAHELSKQKPLKGFRPGKAPRHEVERAYGAMAVIEAALEYIVNHTYYQAITDNKLHTVGKPKIEVKQVVPGNDFIYIAEVALLPEVTLGSVEEVTAEYSEVKVIDDEVIEVLKDLQNARSSEVLVKREARDSDKVEIDFAVKVDNVVIDGGSGKKYPLILGSKMFIPGFEEAIVGMKADDSKTFKLKLPDNYKPDIAGKEADVEVKLFAVYERKLPALDDELAKAAGAYKNLAELKEQITKNLQADKQAKADQQFEVAIFKELVKSSQFSAVPETLIDNEIHKMQHEMEDNLKQYNINLDQYLERVGKQREDLEKDWHEQAETRVKTALIARAVAEQEKIAASNEDIESEIKHMEVIYKDNEEVMKNLRSSDFREYLFHTLTNKKVVDHLKQVATKK